MKRKTLTLSNWKEKFTCRTFHPEFYEIMQLENLSQMQIVNFFIRWPIQNFDHRRLTNLKSSIMSVYSTDQGKFLIKVAISNINSVTKTMSPILLWPIIFQIWCSATDLGRSNCNWWSTLLVTQRKTFTGSEISR